MSSTVLVTGGAGFIGSSLVRNLLDTTQDTMIVLDKLTYAGNLDSLGRSLDDPRVSFVEGDIGDQALVSDLLQSNQVKQTNSSHSNLTNQNNWIKSNQTNQIKSNLLYIF